ncbi:hypothetical protein C2857_005917 [Epichloe festucae Fl1]|uniref:Serine aminopeptidase S33 domain-containing protein n=1 Tax=Epichloe festucae (strain Fl1) TaxID=877507 RepID=A0A7S9KT98_EPIFF|nr:hypothetical protein C2857_005917 [Epichloe festucae Fl1]
MDKLPWPTLPHAALVVTTTAMATTSLIVLARIALWPRKRAVLKSPLRTVMPRLSSEELAGLAYVPDSFPGARDVDTPYGTIRAYEFGPQRGQKVLLVHGISTSCITLSRIAHALVDRGCRVMLFDLFGRGFSDGVGDLPHDTRLYTSQMLAVLASSPLCWTGTGAFRLVGYSLGGGIAVPFANAFPHMVSSLVLLAPAGLIDASSFGPVVRFVFSSGLVPERVLAVLTGRRLQRPIASSSTRAAAVMAAAEAEDLHHGDEVTTTTPLEMRVLDYVRWMVLNHEGFVPAFMSCIRHAPLMGQHEQWRGLARRRPGTTAVIFAETDELIHESEYREHGLPLAGGEGHVSWRVVPGSHDFVMTHPGRIMDELDDFWGVKS